jgi:ribonucleoside-diphosphate reductase beta chain
MRVLKTTTAKRLDYNSFPYRLYEKAKKFGVWNPAEIDLTQDKTDWEQATETDRLQMLRILAQFQAGEEAVTQDILPLITVMAKEGRLEDEMYLTTFLFEEAKHTEFFRRWLDEVAHETGDLRPYVTESYKKIFYEKLPAAMNRLYEDASPEALLQASVTYNMVVEGVLAETGYYSFFETMQAQNVMPGLLKGIGLLKMDESRHIGYGTYLLQRLLSENPSLWDLLNQTMNELMPLALGVVNETFLPDYQLPEGVTQQQFIDYATKQIMVRMDVLSRARNKTVEEIDRLDVQELGVL